MAAVCDALEYLSQPAKQRPKPVCVVFGDEAFLRRLVIQGIRDQVLEGQDAEFSLTRFDGATCPFRDVIDELATVALFGGGPRLVLIEDADPFVTANRAALENYAANPHSTGVLVLDVVTWAKTTRLYKSLESTGLQVDCKAPTEAALGKWLVLWAKKRHRAVLELAAAQQLIEAIGPEVGLLDQELAKLAVSVAAGQPIRAELVRELVGGWRAKTAWEMIDAATAGDAKEALSQLDRLLLAGEVPVGVLAQFAVSMRRFAAATQVFQEAETLRQRMTLTQALELAGVKSFVVKKAEGQLKQLGRRRAGQFYRWLLEADLDLKGNSAMPPRIILERLIVRMSKAIGN